MGKRRRRKRDKAYCDGKRKRKKGSMAEEEKEKGRIRDLVTAAAATAQRAGMEFNKNGQFVELHEGNAAQGFPLKYG